jgi:hypothetical protein
MPFNMPKAFGRQRLVRAALALLVLAVAAIGQYKLTNFSRPVSLETAEKFAPAIVNLSAQEELVIEGPVSGAKEGLLLSDDGRPNETVDVTFERAQLANETIEELVSLGKKPPTTQAQIVYQANESEHPPIGEESCRTRVELHIASKPPAEIHLFQIGPSGRERYRQLELKATGAELNASIAALPPENSTSAPACQKVLKVGDWEESINELEAATVMAADSTVHFEFHPLKATSWDGAEGGFFEPFDLGAEQLEDGSPAFQAHAVTIKPRRGGASGAAAPARLRAQSVDGGELLTVSGLKIGSEQFRISVAGKGWVQVDGEYATVNLLGLVRENTVISLLLIALNGALLTWAARMIFKKPHPSPPNEQPSA